MGTELREDGGIKVLVSLACIVIVIAGMREASSIIVPFLLSVFIAVMCAGPFSWLRSKGVPAIVAVLLIIAVILGAMFGIGAVIGASVSDFSLQVPLYQKRIHSLLIALIIWLRSFGIHISENVLLDYFDPGSIMQIVANLLSGLGSALTYALLILFIVVFILIEASNFSKKLVKACGASETSLETIDKILRSIEKYLALKTWISVATGIVVMLLLMVLGVNYAVLWGLVAFLLNYIPNIGPLIAALPPILLSPGRFGPGLGNPGDPRIYHHQNHYGRYPRAILLGQGPVAVDARGLPLPDILGMDSRPGGHAAVSAADHDHQDRL